MSDDRRLIEDYLPIEAISAEASREKSVRKGHISTLHIWWARRPLVACRAAIYAALVPVSRFVPNGASDGKRKSLGRANAAKFVQRLCRYPSESKPGESADIDRAIREARQHILEAHAERLTTETGNQTSAEDIAAGRSPRPKVLDMFAGGGAIPLEALRLGCEAHALDLNPVAHIVELCTLVYPQKYGKPDPTARGMTGPRNAKEEATWGGLAAEVRYWGNWVLKQVQAEIGDLYPPIPDPKFRGKVTLYQVDWLKGHDPKDVPRGFLTPVAYLWTRTVKCKNPACGATVPLAKQTWLCKKQGRCVALKIVAPRGAKKVRFEVVEGKSEEDLGFDPSTAFVGGSAPCRFCRSVADSEYVKEQGRSGRLGYQFLAIAATRPGRQGKVYLDETHLPETIIPDEENFQNRLAEMLSKKGVLPLEETIEINPRSMDVDQAGITKWSQLFSARQTISLLTVGTSVRSSIDEMRRLGFDVDRAKAVSTLLGCGASKLADFCSTLCTFNFTGGRGVKNSFPQHSLPMVWDFAETNPFNPAGASWVAIIDDLPAAIEMLSSIGQSATVQRGSATSLPLESESMDAVITDPPYYDNVSYSNLSDFFLIWLRRAIGDLYPEHFATGAAPKKQEIIAAAYRHGGSKKDANKFYEEMMQRRLLRPDEF